MLAAEPINAPWQTADIAEEVTFKVSPATKSVVVLPTPVFVYFTYKVSGSVEVAGSTAITLATTCEVAPVISVLRKSERFVVPVKEVSLIE